METDKLVAEIPSPFKGKIHKLLHEMNETCLVGKALCELLVEDSSEPSTGDQPVAEHHIAERDELIDSSKSMYY